MIKSVLDPLRVTTAYTPFGVGKDRHRPMFAVCDGVHIEDALVHLSMTLRSAFETNIQVCERSDRTVGVLAWATYQSLEVSQALVDALLGGLAEESGRKID